VDQQPRSPLRRPEKGARDRLIRLAEANPEWVLGFEEEVWWSRVALPAALHGRSSAEGKPPPLTQHSVARDDPDPKAISCYGLYLPELEQRWLRFVEGRPVSAISTRFLQWSCEKLAVSWARRRCFWCGTTRQLAQEQRGTRSRIASHDREVKKSARGVRIEYPVCFPSRVRGSTR
jgi:hypothetical protein